LTEKREEGRVAPLSLHAASSAGPAPPRAPLSLHVTAEAPLGSSSGGGSLTHSLTHYYLLLSHPLTRCDVGVGVEVAGIVCTGTVWRVAATGASEWRSEGSSEGSSGAACRASE
jgi:hypothetical protein